MIRTPPKNESVGRDDSSAPVERILDLIRQMALSTDADDMDRISTSYNATSELNPSAQTTHFESSYEHIERAELKNKGEYATKKASAAAPETTSFFCKQHYATDDPYTLQQRSHAKTMPQNLWAPKGHDDAFRFQNNVLPIENEDASSPTDGGSAHANRHHPGSSISSRYSADKSSLHHAKSPLHFAEERTAQEHKDDGRQLPMTEPSAQREGTTKNPLPYYHDHVDAPIFDITDLEHIRWQRAGRTHRNKAYKAYKGTSNPIIHQEDLGQSVRNFMTPPVSLTKDMIVAEPDTAFENLAESFSTFVIPDGFQEHHMPFQNIEHSLEALHHHDPMHQKTPGVQASGREQPVAHTAEGRQNFTENNRDINTINAFEHIISKTSPDARLHMKQMLEYILDHLQKF